MRIILFIWLGIGCQFFHLKAQNTKADYTIYYQFQWITNTTERTYSAPEEYLLYRVDNESRFLNSHAYHNDSIQHYFKETYKGDIYTQEALNQYMEGYNSNMKRLTSELRVVKDFKTKNHQIVLYGTWNRHYLQEPFSLKWKTVPGVDTIAGLPCYKATTQHGGRHYTAWYTPQIPISDGPYIFHGLPGLITKITDAEALYLFELLHYTIKPGRNYYNVPFITQDYPQQVDRDTYVTNSKKEKENPTFPHLRTVLSPEQLLRLKNERKTRFDLLIEKK